MANARTILSKKPFVRNLQAIVQQNDNSREFWFHCLRMKITKCVGRNRFWVLVSASRIFMFQVTWLSMIGVQVLQNNKIKRDYKYLIMVTFYSIIIIAESSRLKGDGSIQHSCNVYLFLILVFWKKKLNRHGLCILVTCATKNNIKKGHSGSYSCCVNCSQLLL